jgi:hypothetical protein
MKTLSKFAILAFLGLGLVGCTPEGTTPGPDDPDDPQTPADPQDPQLPTETPPASNAMAPFEHPMEPERDPFIVFEEMIEEGPRDYTARVHGCTKMPYAVIGRYLQARGVNTGNMTADTAGALYRAAQNSIGVPNLTNKVRDPKEWSTAAFTDLLDIMGASVPEVTTAMPNQNACKRGGASVNLFGTDAAGATTLTADGVTCLLGLPATPEMLELGAAFLKQATSDADGRILVVASLMASAQLCQ